MSLHVVDAGLYSLLVGSGRRTCRHLGVPVGGAADRLAHTLGNALVGNAADAAALEVTLAGPTVEARQTTACVVFGAPFDCNINGTGIAAGTTFTLQPGDRLRIGGTRQGCRGYLCIAGGFQAPEILGSQSTLEPLQSGDELRCRPSRTQSRFLPFCQVLPESPVTLRVFDGPQHDWFTDTSFFTQTYEVAAASNRMGLRLNGRPLVRRLGELVSEAVAPGAVQVTNDGLPVALGVDGQTIGGYPKIAHVVRADLDQLGQLRPGHFVRFVRVSVAEAEAAAQLRAEFLAHWLTSIRIAERQPEFS